MSYPFRVRTWKSRQRLNPGQYSAPNTAGSTVMPTVKYVKAEWEEAADALQRQRSNNFFTENLDASDLATKHIDPRKIVPPFVAGEGDRTLVHLRNNAATKLPLKPLQKKLLPYAVRRTATKSMLHGGVRTTGLNMPPPALAITHSEQLALPTLHEERRDLRWDAADFAMHLTPLNMHNDYKYRMWHNRAVDLQKRLKKEMSQLESKIFNGKIVFKNKNIRYVQPHSSELRVEPYTKDEWMQIRAESAEARQYSLEQGLQYPAAHTQKDAYLPFQSIKPHSYGVWNITNRNNVPIMAQMDLKQERLNRKGFGWKALQNSMWQQDLDTARYKPDRGYHLHPCT
jgi:hypothetical protein